MEKDYFKSPNNIGLGEIEIKHLINYLKITRDEFVNRLKENSISFYFHIDTVSYKLNVTEPPHIFYEIYLLFKKENNYYQQIFSKKKYSPEFQMLNSFEQYIPLMPYDQSIYTEYLEYPLYQKCFKNNIYSNEEVNILKNILNKKRFPEDITNIILEYVVKAMYSKRKNQFIVTSKNLLKKNIYVDKFITTSNAEIIIAIKV